MWACSNGEVLVGDHMALCAELCDDFADPQRVPDHDGVVQGGKAGEGVDLILEGAAAHGALLAEEQEARQHVRALSFVQLLPDVPPVAGIVEEAEHEHRFSDPADLRQRLVQAVLPGV